METIPMKMNRRNVLIGVGAIVAGGGAALGTGAFSQVEATRTVTVETAGDAEAFLALTPADGAGDYVDDDGDRIEIDITGNDEDGEGVNQDALTTFNELVKIENQGTNDVVSIDLEIEGDNGEDEILSVKENFDGGDFPLAPGNDVTFGLEIELRVGEVSGDPGAFDDGDINDDNFDPTIKITANTE